jgi:nicotinamide mononucleotide transporter PnuC
MSFLDASSNCINIAGVILFNLRYIETWYVWLANNVLDMIIWTIVFINAGPGSLIMFVTCIVYLVLNFYGLVNWFITIKKDNKKREAIK